MAGEAFKGKIVKGATTVLGMATWSYAGEEQRIAEYTEFQNPHAMQVPVLKVGGDVTITGRYIQGDPGVALLQTAFDNQEEITDMKLYKNASNYLMPDPAVSKENGTTFASHLLMTKSPRAFNFDSAGLGQVEVTLRVVGQLKEY